MTKTKDVNQQGIIKRAASESSKPKPQSLKDWVQKMTPQIAKALPQVITPERFTRIALTALSSNPRLAECDRNSFLGGLMQAAQLGLEPNTPLGQAYLIPFRNKKRKITECQFIVGYKGLIDLAYRSGDVKTIQAYCVHENDDFEYELGLNSKLYHKPAKTNRGNIEYVYGLFKLHNDGYGFEVMSVEDVIAHAKKHSQSYDKSFSPWKSDFESMAKKTVLKKALKYAPIKTEFLQATIADESVSSVKDDDYEDIEVEYRSIDDFEEMPEEVANNE